MGAQFDRIPRKQLQRMYEMACEMSHANEYAEGAGVRPDVEKDLETVRAFFKLKRVPAPKEMAPCHFCKKAVDKADNYCSGCNHVSCSECSVNDALMGSHHVDEHLRDERD